MLPIDNLYDADLIIQTESGITFLCYLNPDISQDPKRNTPIEQQLCWRIVKVTLQEESNQKRISRQYPNGDAYHYSYSPSLIDSYTFEYRK